MNYSDKQVLVLGLGESGLAMARWLRYCGARVRVADTRAAPQRLPQLLELAASAGPAVEFVAGEFDAALLTEVDFIAVSPGLAPRIELANILPAAQEKNLPVWGEIELFAQALAALKAPAAAQVAEVEHPIVVDAAESNEAIVSAESDEAAAEPVDVSVESATESAAESATESTTDSATETVTELPVIAPPANAEPKGYSPKIIAITGTNGKTTVTSMVGLLCARAGLTVQVAGNISPAALDVLLDALQNNRLPQVWVLELSSFQLHFTYSLQADAATVLNLTQDHLDWHLDMQEYARDKARIFAPQTVRVLNREDATVLAMQAPKIAPVIAKKGAPIAEQEPAPAIPELITFGCNVPQQLGCFGLTNERGVQWLSHAVLLEENAEPPKRRKKGEIAPPPDLALKHLMPADALKIRGQHNAANALAALALCRAIGLPFAPLLHALRDYQGEPHRVELVRVLNDVSWYDDSKGTNVGATVAALKGLGGELAQSGESNRRLVLIAGGVGKDQDFSPLAEPVARYVRSVVLIGRDAPAITLALQECGVILLQAQNNLQEAVQMASEAAQPGDVVLFSPACASFDMFNNYVHRAQMFVECVNELALSRGELV